MNWCENQVICSIFCFPDQSLVDFRVEFRRGAGNRGFAQRISKTFWWHLFSMCSFHEAFGFPFFTSHLWWLIILFHWSPKVGLIPLFSAKADIILFGSIFHYVDIKSGKTYNFVAWTFPIYFCRGFTHHFVALPLLCPLQLGYNVPHHVSMCW